MHTKKISLLSLAVFSSFLLTSLCHSFAANTVASSLQPDNNIQVDNKITNEEKDHYKAVAEHSDQYAPAQAQAINKIPGVKVSAEDLKESDKKGSNLNPINWLFKPVIRLQEQSVKLEQDIMKLTGPIASLQPAMLSLQDRMTSMQGQLGHLEDKTSSVQKQLDMIRQDIHSMHSTLSGIKVPVEELKEPIMSLHDPILKIEKPIVGVDKDLTEVKVLLSLLLTSVFIASLVIAIGTPIAAILVWRHREKILPKPDQKQLAEEHKIKQATQTIDHQLHS